MSALPSNALASQRIVLIPLVWLVVALGSTGSAQVIVDWEDGTWNHGSGNVTGYQNGQSSGSTVTDGVTVTVSWQNFGTSTGNHNSLGGTQPTVSTSFNGGGSDGALTIASSNDGNALSASPPVNYSALTITFSQLVELDTLYFGDIDRSGGNSWQDFLAVEAKAGGAAGTPATVSYTPTPTWNSEATHRGLNGVRGAPSVGTNRSDSSNQLSDVDVTITGYIDYMIIYFMQGPDQPLATAEHGIWFRDFSGTAIPESESALLMAALLLGWMFQSRFLGLGRRG